MLLPFLNLDDLAPKWYVKDCAPSASGSCRASNPAGFVYGLITIGALMAAESGRHESYLDALASALFATLLYWLARAYAEVLGSRLEHGERLTA